ncbi:MAG: hypothetical protein ACREDR_32700 [Blastocatellia bacterium]
MSQEKSEISEVENRFLRSLIPVGWRGGTSRNRINRHKKAQNRKKAIETVTAITPAAPASNEQIG